MSFLRSLVALLTRLTKSSFICMIQSRCYHVMAMIVNTVLHVIANHEVTCYVDEGRPESDTSSRHINGSVPPGVSDNGHERKTTTNPGRH